MIYQERKHFSFVSKGLPEDTFTVVRFTGTEAISSPYEYDITLVSDDPDIDLKAVLQNPARLTVQCGEEEFSVHGLAARFEQLHELEHSAFYRAFLVPRLWLAGLYRENQIFLDKTVPQIIEEILKQAGLKNQDYEFKLTRSYPSWEYICQYHETDLQFISRWMEREGIYYFFEQSDQAEKLIITDSLTAHQDIKGEKTLYYSPPSGLVPAEEEVVKAFVCRQRVLPKKVILKDYNYRKPSLEVKGEAEVDAKGRGETYLYGEHFKHPGEGKDLARIRAEELLCRETEYRGEATAPTLAPGFQFELADHFRKSYNRKYLVIEVVHRGTQTGLQLAGLEAKQTEGEKEPGYSNRFSCLPADVQFRPERKTPKPRINGTMTAFVDAAGDGATAEIDDQGRYKVILPLDLSGRSGGKASRWVRMAQPYSGPEYGVHFPLHKGAEVLLTFIDGDPDRPIISAAIPNPQTMSPVTSANRTQSIIRDNYGNEIIFDATPGDEHIRLHSPHHNSGVEIGKSFGNWTQSDHGEFTVGGSASAVLGASLAGTVGAGVDINIGHFWTIKGAQNFNFIHGGSHTWDFGYNYNYNSDAVVTHSEKDILTRSKDDQILAAGDQLCLLGGAKKKQTKSIINIFPDSISLSVGKKGNYLSDTGALAAAARDDIDLSGGRALKKRWTEGDELYTAPPTAKFLAANLALSATFVATLAAATALKKDCAAFLGGVSIGTLVLSVASWALIRDQMEAKKIEPVAHSDPAASIELKNTGEIKMSSKSNMNMGSKKSIVIKSGVGHISLDAADGVVKAKGAFNHRHFKIVA